MPGVYISFPFCSQKCTYCNFASGVLPRQLESEYLRAVEREILAHEWEWTPETVYFGGGTPSQMPPEALERLLALIPGAPWREATIEAAPGSISAKSVARWRDAGINRASLGVQSFIAAELARTGRRHRAETVAADVGALRDAGIGNFNVDLIAGLPGQTRESWGESLDWIERLEPDHVSVYMLEVDGDSRLGREILAGGGRYGAALIPSDDLILEFYETAVDRLSAMGIHRYEISNFARPGRESEHNLKYWRLEPYIGFGADAHSFDSRLRWQNVETAQEYTQRVLGGESPRADVSEAHPGEEQFFIGLRLMSGIEPAPEEWRRYEEPIRRGLDGGLLERDGAILRLTRRGVLLSNEIFSEFIQA